MVKFIKFCVIISLYSVCCACGAKGSLATLRAERQPYLQENINLPYTVVKKNIIDDRRKNGSLLMLYENSEGNILSLVSQNNHTGEIACFFDFISDENKTIVKVYDWVCAKKFIDATIASAKSK